VARGAMAPREMIPFSEDVFVGTELEVDARSGKDVFGRALPLTSARLALGDDCGGEGKSVIFVFVGSSGLLSVMVSARRASAAPAPSKAARGDLFKDKAFESSARLATS
jgi:hypothetical protein